MSENAVSLVDISDSVMTFTLGEHEYKVRRLELQDHADAQQHIRDANAKGLCDNTRFASVISEECLASALAKIQTQPITNVEVWNDLRGELFLLARIFQVGEQKFTGTQIRLGKAKGGIGISRALMNKLLLWAADLGKTDDDDPLAELTDTGKSLTDPSNGTGPSANCATPTDVCPTTSSD